MPDVPSKHSLTDVADPAILADRASHGLDQYVPFHFLQRSPFDYAVVNGRSGSKFVLIAVLRVTAQSLGWKVIPQHPLADGQAPDVLSWEDGVEAISWEEMDKFPRNYATDHRCKMVCMAEALSPTAVTPNLFQSIFVATEETRTLVATLVSEAGLSLYVNTNPNMFPPGAR